MCLFHCHKWTLPTNRHCYSSVYPYFHSFCISYPILDKVGWCGRLWACIRKSKNLNRDARKNMPARAKKNGPFYCSLSSTRVSIALERQSYLLLERLLPRRQKVIPYLACMSWVIRRWWETVFKFSGFSTRFPIINTLFAQALSKPGWCQTYQLWIATVCFRNCPRQSPNTRFKAIWT